MKTFAQRDAALAAEGKPGLYELACDRKEYAGESKAAFLRSALATVRAEGRKLTNSDKVYVQNIANRVWGD